jgi:hypothetical protein
LARRYVISAVLHKRGVSDLNVLQYLRTVHTVDVNDILEVGVGGLTVRPRDGIKDPKETWKPKLFQSQTPYPHL